MKVRAATPDDIPALASIAARSYRHGFSGILEEEALAQRDQPFFAARFEDLWPHCLVAEADRPVAFGLMRDGHIDMLFTDPLAIGQGAGTVLLRALDERGARTLECFAANARARRFYEARGWRVLRAYRRTFVGRERDFVLYGLGQSEAPSA